MKYIVEALVRNEEDYATVTKTFVLESNLDLSEEEIFAESEEHFERNGYLLLEILDVNLGE